MSKGIPKKTVAVVIERDHGLCVLRISPDCTGTADVADHRANRGHGGAKSGVLDRPSNLIAACGICNGYKESNANRAELERRGVRVRGDSTHAKTAQRALLTPVLYPDGHVYWLDDFGGRELDEGQPW
ncbi:hypothetical protein JD276_15245 [Leucobacter sp. CSA1]|uniref:HNH endonuclease n=1 Tax=Leucobacter chromiisoli TaxID=2796471 RepID=A0A934Q9Q5_9MICO|nr:hypothetical protein [Leucobacter chromiisoli]MBK0420383.1 hypothetical protein [Leucobacter chromiisoli]